MRDIIGISHVAGRYSFTDKDYLNEGADQILQLGSRVIKVWFFNGPNGYPNLAYPYNSDWPKVESLVEGAQLPYFRDLFSKPFTTYILGVTSMGRNAGYWLDGISGTQLEDEEQQFYELTKHFLMVYRHTNKTFVLQHWEGDWMLRGKNKLDGRIDPDPEAFTNMIKWLNARQAGVERARNEVGMSGARVFHAAEVNQVVLSMLEGRPNMVNQVLPHVNLDLVSYSAWDVAISHRDKPDSLRRALDFIASHSRKSKYFGYKNVYIGEFGIPENDYTPEIIHDVVSKVATSAIEWGCPYVVYWQIYCNELRDPKITVPVSSNKAVRGFWLIRPDGSKAWSWNYLHDLLSNTETH